MRYALLSDVHANPAVTLGFWSVRRFPTADVIPYISSQCAGALAAAAVLGWLLGPVANFGATVPSLPVTQAFVVEMGFSGILAFVISAAATDSRTPPAIAPFVIGSTVFAGALVTGPLTGGSFNPARTFGPALVGGIWTSHWLYWLAPIAGMIVAMHLYDFLRAATPERDAPLTVTGVEGPIEE